MTFSILAYDERTGVYAGAAATGSLCVGGWVLRGDIESGLCASQGTAPSTFWRDDAIRQMYHGATAAEVVDGLTTADRGRANRQLSVLDRLGRTAGFTGSDSVAFAGVIAAPNLVVAGNMIDSRGVLEALSETFVAANGPPQSRLTQALRAAEAAGSDVRGLQSAALLVLSPKEPPLDLRIDHSTKPLDDLEALVARVARPPYCNWLDEVPVLVDRDRAPRRS